MRIAHCPALPLRGGAGSIHADFTLPLVSLQGHRLCFHGGLVGAALGCPRSSVVLPLGRLAKAGEAGRRRPGLLPLTTPHQNGIPRD
jgi:hypothetical protein